MIDIISFIHQNFKLMGAIVMVLVFIFDSKKLEVKLSSVANFVAFMCIITFIRLGLSEGSVANQDLTKIMGFSSFTFVFLEDAFFTMIPHYITKLSKNKFINAIVWIFFSIAFGIGHAYQGVVGIVITSFYPYFISNRYAKKTSFGTVMVCHYLYDCFTFLFVKLQRILTYL